MGLLNMFKSIATGAERAAEYVETRRGRMPIQWPAGEGDGLIHRMPRDPAQRASMFASSQSVVVNEGEVAIVLVNGMSQGELLPGHYAFDKERVVGALDVVWVRTGRQHIKWGVGNATSVDGVNIGANGEAVVRVIDSHRFNSEVIQGGIKLPIVELQRKLLPGIQGVMRAELARWQAMQLKNQRDAFREAIANSLGEDLEYMGLGLIAFEVVEINFPAEFDAVISGQTMAQFQGQTDLLAAQNRARVTQVETEAEAHRQIQLGMAQAQAMGFLQQQNLDPIKLKAMEALTALAKNPGQDSMLHGDTAKMQLFAKIADSALAPPVSESTQKPDTSHALAGKNAESLHTEIQNDASQAKETQETIQRKIDRLTERLIEGEISEATFNRALTNLESKRDR